MEYARFKPLPLAPRLVHVSPDALDIIGDGLGCIDAVSLASSCKALLHQFSPKLPSFRADALARLSLCCGRPAQHLTFFGRICISPTWDAALCRMLAHLLANDDPHLEHLYFEQKRCGWPAGVTSSRERRRLRAMFAPAVPEAALQATLRSLCVANLRAGDEPRLLSGMR